MSIDRLYENAIKLLLAVLIFMRLAFNQLYISSRYTVRFCIMRSMGVEWLNIVVRVLSSAKRVKLKLCEQFGKSLMNIRNSKGPRIDH